MYGYIYKTTNLINGKIYVGQHQYDLPEIDPNYRGSGKLLKEAFLKYGIENFTCDILQICYSKEELDDCEIYWIDKLKSKVEFGNYNISMGGDGGNIYNSLPEDRKLEINKKHSEAILGEKHPFFGKTRSKETKEKIKNTKANQITITNGIISKVINKNDIIPEGWWIGQHQLTEEKLKRKKEKISLKRLGKKCYTNGSENIYLNPEDVCPEGFYLGKSNFSGNKNKIAIINLEGEVRYIPEDSPIPSGWIRGGKSSENKNKIWITNGNEVKYILKTDPIPDGWKKGFKENKNFTAKGKIWITNGVETRYVSSDEEIPEGWRKGRILKRK